MFRAQDGSLGDKRVALILRHPLLVDMQEILPPGVLVKLEELWILEQAKPIDDLPFDAEAATIERLSPSGGGKSPE